MVEFEQILCSEGSNGRHFADMLFPTLFFYRSYEVSSITIVGTESVDFQCMNSVTVTWK